MAYRVQIRRGTASQWSTENPILLDGEFAIEKDTKRFKIGDGITDWNLLSYATQGETGKSIQYIWDETRLGIKQEGDLSYQYVDLKGEKGATGEAGTTSWLGITDKPTEFMPSQHSHDDLYYTEAEVDNKLKNKVDKITGKSLSANDYTDAEKLKNQENADNVSSLQGVRIHEGTTKPTDTPFWYDPSDDVGIIRK